MWRDYDAATVDGELRAMRDLGMTVTRSFFYWPDVMPTPDTLDDAVLDRFAQFLDQHRALGMTTIPTFLVGHMSGQNWDPAWREGRHLFGDVWFVGRQAWYVRSIAERFAGHPAVAAWLLTNEIPIYADWRDRGVGTVDHRQVAAWAQILVDALRAGGARQPVSVGDGAWGVEVTGKDNGFRVRDLAPLVDFLGPHIYRVETDIVRQNLGAAFVCDLLSGFGKPVVLEEFGLSSDFTGDDNAAAYYRQTLHNTLLGGATGWLAWNNTDYDGLADQEPYSHHAHEMHFGLTDSEGRGKPQALEIKKFAQVLDLVDFVRCSRPAADTALVVSSYLEKQYDFTQPADAAAVVTATHQAYVAAREADLPVAIAREADGLPEGARLYLVPSAKQLTAPTWRRLTELAESGAWVYASYFNGDHAVHRGPWWPRLDETFGVHKTSYYGVTSPVPTDTATVRFLEDLGSITAGTELTFVMGGGEHGRSFLPVTVGDDARVVAVDQDGHPVLGVRPVGRGAMVLCTYPLEYMAGARWHDNPEPTWALYAGLADAAGVRRPVSTGDPRVAASWLEHEDGRRFVWLVNLAQETVEVTAHLETGRLRDLSTGVPLGSGPLTLGAHDVVVAQWDVTHPPHHGGDRP